MPPDAKDTKTTDGGSEEEDADAEERVASAAAADEEEEDISVHTPDPHVMAHVAAGTEWSRPKVTSLHRCKEDATNEKYEPSRNEKLWRHVVLSAPASSSSAEPTTPWTTRFNSNKSLVLPFPHSRVRYTNRLRSRRLKFTLTRSKQEAHISPDKPSTLFCSFSREAIHSTMFDCQDAACNHMCVPLRIRLEGYRTEGVPPVSITFQLATDEFRLSEEEKRSVHNWLPPRTYEAISHSGNEKHAVTHVGGHSLDFNVCRDYSDLPRLLLKTDPYFVNPELFDWLSVLNLGTDRIRAKYTQKPEISKSQKVLIPQPNPKTNICPSPLSHFASTHMRARNNGSSEQILKANTVNVNGVNCWNLDESIYKSLESEILSLYSKRRVAMDLTNGLTLVFSPSDAALWNKGLKEDIHISVTLLIDYVVIGKKNVF